MARNSTERTLNATCVIDYHGDMVVLKCNTGLPPGSRVLIKLPVELARGVAFQGKIVNLKKDGDDGFEVKVRLHNLSREMKDLMEAVGQ